MAFCGSKHCNFPFKFIQVLAKNKQTNSSIIDINVLLFDIYE